MRRSNSDIRLVATLIVAAGLIGAGVAIFAEDFGLGAEAAPGMFGWKRITLLVASMIVAAVGVPLVARPRIVTRLVGWQGSSSLSPKWFQIGLLAQVVAGGLIVGIGIGSAPFWWDEIASVSVAERSPSDIFRVLGKTDANMGFYYLLLHAWMWGGDSEAWVRALSALPAVAAIPTTAILARRLFGDRIGLAAGFLLAGSMFVVAGARDARGYALALLLITVATLLFVEAVRSRRPAHFLAYGAASVLAVYASPLSGLVLVAHATSLPFVPRARDIARPFALTYGAVLLAVAPLAAAMFAIGAERQVGWIERPGLSDALDTAWEMLGRGNRPLAVVYAALIIIGSVALWRRGWVSGEQQGETWRWRRSLVLGWLLLPPVLLCVFSQVQPLLQSRYLLTSAPALAIAAAIGLVVLARRSRVLAIAATAVVVCLAVLARVGLESYEEEAAQGHRAAARVIAAESMEGDGVAYVPTWQRLPLKWNLKREAAPGADLPDDFAVARDAEDVGDLWAWEVSPEILVSRLRGHPRVWLVRWTRGGLGPYEPMLDVGVPVLRSEYKRVRWHDFGDIKLEVYEREDCC